MEDAGQSPQQQQLQQQAAQQLMTKLPSLTPSAGTTLIHRSGHCYQLHRPHLGLAPSSQDSPMIENPRKKHKPDQQQQQPDSPSYNAAGAEQQLADPMKQQIQPLHEQLGQQYQLQQHPLAGSQALLLQQQQQQHPHQQQHHLTGYSVSHILDGLGRQAQRRPKPARPQPGSSTHVSCLYPEILAQIFSNLDVRDRGRAAQVCVAWREAAYHRSAWRGVEAKLHIRNHTSAMFHCLEKRGIRRVQVLSLTMRRGLVDVFQGVPKLQSLNLSGCFNMSDTGLSKALRQGFPALTELNLSLCKHITDSSLDKIAHYLRNLESLDIAGCSNVTNAGLQAIAFGLKKLKRLNMRSCWHITDQGISFLAGAPGEEYGTPELEHLGLQDCQRLSDESLRHLAAGLGSSLRSIVLSFCTIITDSGMKHVAKITSLRELVLRSCDNISEIGMAYLAEGGSRISSLDVSFCDKIGDQALQHISQGLFELRSLGLGSTQVSDEGIAKIARQRIVALQVGQCNKLTDRTVDHIVESMPDLKSIDLYGCNAISEQARRRLHEREITVNVCLWHESR